MLFKGLCFSIVSIPMELTCCVCLCVCFFCNHSLSLLKLGSCLNRLGLRELFVYGE